LITAGTCFDGERRFGFQIELENSILATCLDAEAWRESLDNYVRRDLDKSINQLLHDTVLEFYLRYDFQVSIKKGVDASNRASRHFGRGGMTIFLEELDKGRLDAFISTQQRESLLYLLKNSTDKAKKLKLIFRDVMYGKDEVCKEVRRKIIKSRRGLCHFEGKPTQTPSLARTAWRLPNSLVSFHRIPNHSAGAL